MTSCSDIHFPGPGLAVRILGSVTKERLDLLREADAIFTEELHTSSGFMTKSGRLLSCFFR